MPKRTSSEAFSESSESLVPLAKRRRPERTVNLGSATDLGNHDFNLDGHLRQARSNFPRTLQHAPPDLTEPNIPYASERPSTYDDSKGADVSTLWADPYPTISHTTDSYAQNGLFNS